MVTSPAVLVDLCKVLYTDMLSCVGADGCDSQWLLVHQGYMAIPDLFLISMDRLLYWIDHHYFVSTSIATEHLPTTTLCRRCPPDEDVVCPTPGACSHGPENQIKIQTTDTSFLSNTLVPTAGEKA